MSYVTQRAIGSVAIIPPTSADSLAAARQVRLDDSSEAGVLYIGKAPAGVAESTAAWVLSKWVEANSALYICATLSAWDNRLSATYGD